MADNIYQLISKISEEAGHLEATKDPASGLKFAFRGVNAVVNHFAPLLRKHGVITVPEVLDRTTSTRELNGGKAITQTDVKVAYHFYGPDGDDVVATTLGLAQDYADRSAAQAMSVAYRVALLQVFSLPTDDKEPEVAGEEVQKYIEGAGKHVNASTGKPVKQTDPAVEIGDLKAKISKTLKVAGISSVKAYGDKFFDGRDGWDKSVVALQKLLKAVEAGEILE